ncbi:MAG: 4Fe-4S dicluster domain-containing protein, partial [Bilophila sp.]
MSRYRFVTDTNRCIACKACEAICKATHDIAPGIWLGRLVTDGPRFADASVEATPIRTAHPAAGFGNTAPQTVAVSPSAVVLHTRFRACLQCAQPKCVEACPTGALTKRPEDGIVFVTAALCTGCGACQKACPHALLWTDPRSGKTVKCDQCKTRLDAGLKPACVTVCPTKALQLVEKPGRE